MASLDILLGDQSAAIQSAQVNGSRMDIKWGNGKVSQFPLLMLRDSCSCRHCFSPTTNSRLILFEQLLGTNCQATDCALKDGDLYVEWLDGHASKYSPDWLYRRRLEPDGVQDRLTKVYTGVVDTPWSSCDPQQIIKKRSYDDIVRCDEAIVEFVETLITDGLFLVENSPDKDCLVEFLKGIGATYSSTHYSSSIWRVQNDPGSKDLPNSGKKLELHIDMPYLTKPCQLQLLHCLKQCSNGGDNKLSDALRAAQILKREDPEHYRLLSTVEVDFQFIKRSDGNNWFICNRAPVIQEDPKTGLPTLCRFAAEVRCSSFNQPIDVVEAWFVAFRNYWRILEENSILVKSRPGDIIVFNNGRVMHARESFDVSEPRELEGIYAEWDYLLSAWRMAKVRLAERNAPQS